MSIVNDLKQNLALNVKNLVGWKTKRKIVVFSIDDYGNVRLDSKKARDNMFAKGLKASSRFDLYDTLETEEDLLALYDTLSSVKDKNGNHPVFTAFAVCANINFERMRESGYSEYIYEELPATFQKLKGYENVWSLWQEGMQQKLLIPQFHGREHLNVKVLMKNLVSKNEELFISLDNRSYSALNKLDYNITPYVAAFDFNEFNENEQLKLIIEDGLNIFNRVFGFKAKHFNPCGNHGISETLEPSLLAGGINYIDTERFKQEHLGNGAFGSRVFNYTGKKNKLGQVYLVRNCVFEPTEKRGVDWVNFCLKQVEASFRWNQAANISSHRVNYCGHIDPQHRKEGLNALGQLVKGIVDRWPDVEFMTSDELGDLITEN
jgi:hypothetical protein